VQRSTGAWRRSRFSPFAFRYSLLVLGVLKPFWAALQNFARSIQIRISGEERKAKSEDGASIA